MASKELKFVRKNLNPIISHCHDDWNTLHTLTIIRNYDPQLLVHCINTEKYVRQILEHLGKTDEALCTAALLHDIGKIYLSNSILFKPGKLDSVERTAVNMHSYYGYTYLKNKGFSERICEYVLYHHGRKNEWKDLVPAQSVELEYNTDILRAADIYDAMTSDRPYRKATSRNIAFSVLEKENIEENIISSLTCETA
mgnify:FL=1